MLRVINHRPESSKKTLITPLVGACLEINTPRVNLLCDAGVFFPADQEFIDVLATRKKWQPQIDYPVLAAKHYHCLLSHGHTDHYAGLFALNTDTRVDAYAGELTWRVFNETAALLTSKRKGEFSCPDVRHAGTFENGRPFYIDDCRIIPITVKHDIPDCWAFVIECSGIRLLYAPEFMDRFWLKEPEMIRDIDAVVIGYIPDVAAGDYVKRPNKKNLLLRGEQDSLVFYVTPGENLENIEKCLKDFDGMTFISPYVNKFFSLLPKAMKEEFPLINETPVFDERHIPAETGLVACNYTEIAGYLKSSANSAKSLYIVSNDFSLSIFARGIKKEQISRFGKAVVELKKRGQFFDAFQSSHGSQKLVRELLSHLLRRHARLKIMVTHAISNTSLRDAFGERIELIDEFYV